MIMVMLGGLTMWIDPKSVPARVSMGKHSRIKSFGPSFSPDIFLFQRVFRAQETSLG